MAWSDAARAAALEARRAHGKAVDKGRLGNANVRKSLYHFPDGRVSKSGPRTMWDTYTSRQKIASELKSIRKGRKTVSGLSPARIAQVAAVSTRYRNNIAMTNSALNGGWKRGR